MSLIDCPSAAAVCRQTADDTIRAVDTYSVDTDTLGERGDAPVLYNSGYVRKAINSNSVKNKNIYINKKAHNSQIKKQKNKMVTLGEKTVGKAGGFL